MSPPIEAKIYWATFVKLGNFLFYHLVTLRTTSRFNPLPNVVWYLSLPAGLVSSVTRWLDYVTNFGHLLQWNLTQYHNLFAKVGSKFCQILEQPSKNCQRLLKFRIWSHCSWVSQSIGGKHFYTEYQMIDLSFAWQRKFWVKLNFRNLNFRLASLELITCLFS